MRPRNPPPLHPLASFGHTVYPLKDVLPVGTTLNAETVRNHVHRVAEQISSDLKPDEPHLHWASQCDLAQLPEPEGPIVVGIDGDVKSRNNPTRHFEVIVGNPLLKIGIIAILVWRKALIHHRRIGRNPYCVSRTSN